MTPRLIPFLLSLSCIAAAARAQSTLAVGDSGTRRIARHSADSVLLDLRDGDYAKLTITHHTGLAASVLRPDGLPLLPAAPLEEDDIEFVAEGNGRHAVVIRNDADTAAQYDITFRQRLSLDERTRPLPWRDEVPSPRIAALRRQIDSGNTNTASFWSTVAKEGTPLVEPLDARYDLVTFLWRAEHDTRNVYLRATLGIPINDGVPRDAFQQLGNTDVWYLTLPAPKGARFLYRLQPNRASDRSIAPVTAQRDPLNRGPKQNCPVEANKFDCQSLGELPEATPQPWLAKRPGVAEGRIERQTIHSALQNVDRDLTVYLPAGCTSKAKPCPLVVLFDGDDYLDDNWRGPNTWDNLIAAKKIPPTVVVMVHNLPRRRLFDLIANPTFGDFMAKELAPWARAHYNVSHEASRTIVGGASAGGFAATYLGLVHPEVFGNVLSLSGAFWWSPEHNGGICGGICPKPGDTPPVSNRDATTEGNWMAQVALRRRPSGARFYLAVGLFEYDRAGTGAGILEETRHLRDILLAQGSQVVYQEFVAGHDGLGWRGALADGLLALSGSPILK
ncbi:MAG TPA: alpha/beta hydrolase-fold protein [Gemmatimonadales bacterium]|nr:alpha/beta hydrolase-fold protein [Gemmatimonadales bacterium]